MTTGTLLHLLLFGLPSEPVGGLVLTILTFLAAAAIGIALGAVYATVCVVSKTMAWPAMASSAFLRGVPPIILVFGLAHSALMSLTAAGMLGLALYSFSHVGETLRGYLASYPQAQAEAAKVAGMHPVRDWVGLRLMWSVRHALPAIATHWISLVKDTGALVIVGIGELTTVAKLAAESTSDLATWSLAIGMASALYFATTCALLVGLRVLEKALNAPTRSQACAKALPRSQRAYCASREADNLVVGRPTMLKRLIMILVCGVLGPASLLAADALAAEESRLSEIKERGVIKAGIRRDNPPHSFINGEGEWVGFDVDITEGVADQLGVELEKVPVDELTRISYLQNGTIDIAVASMSHTWKRDEQVDFSQTYFWSGQTFLVDKDKVSDYAGLVGKPVGMSRGSHSIGNWKEWLRRNGHAVDEDKIMEFGNKQTAVQAVRSGAIAGWAEDAEVLASYARQHPELVVLHDNSIGMKQDGIGVRENDSKLRDAINRALQQLATSGAYQDIYDRWFGPDSETPVPQLYRIEVWPNG